MDVCYWLFGVEIQNVYATIFEWALCQVVRECANETDGNPWAKIGDMMDWHCCWLNVVAGKGYTNFLRRTCCKLKLLLYLPSLEFFILHCHSLAVSIRCVNLVSMLPSGARQIPNILQASEVSSLCIHICHWSVSKSIIDPSVWWHVL